MYGRKPVLEALRNSELPVDKVLVARDARGGVVDDLLRAAERRGLEVRRVNRREVTRLSRNGKQDQGVAADVRAPRMGPLEAFLSAPPSQAKVLLLDGITTPANVGMLLRTATAAGLDGVVLPRVGCPEVSPLVIKASAGVAFTAPILRTPDSKTAAEALDAAGFTLVGLRADDAPSLFAADLPPRTALVLGNETTGVSDAVRRRMHSWVCIPMPGGVESLNVSAAGAVVAFEMVRRATT